MNKRGFLYIHMLVDIIGNSRIYYLILKKASGLTNTSKLQMFRHVQSSYLESESFVHQKYIAFMKMVKGEWEHSLVNKLFVEGILLVWGKQDFYITYSDPVPSRILKMLT